MSTPASDSIARSASASREANGNGRDIVYGSTPRVMVTTRSLPRARLGPTAKRLFKDPWRPTVGVLQSQLFELGNLEVWRTAFVEAILMGMWVFGSILIVCSSVVLGGSPVGVTILVASALHTLIFTFYLLAVARKDSTDGLVIVNLNPAVTFLLMLRGDTGLLPGLVIIVAQCVGSILGALIAQDLISDDRVDTFLLGGCFGRRTILMDGTTPVEVGLSDRQNFLAEFMFSFTFLYVTVLLATSKQVKVLGLRNAVFLISGNIGFNIYLSASLRVGYSGSMFNPARCLGPAVAYGQPLWDRLWAPFVAPFVASLAVAFVQATVPAVDHVELYAAKKDVFSKIRRSIATRRGGDLQSPSSRLDNDDELEDNTVYEVPSAGRLYSESPQTPDLRPPPDQSRAV